MCGAGKVMCERNDQLLEAILEHFRSKHDLRLVGCDSLYGLSCRFVFKIHDNCILLYALTYLPRETSDHLYIPYWLSAASEDKLTVDANDPNSMQTLDSFIEQVIKNMAEKEERYKCILYKASI